MSWELDYVTKFYTADEALRCIESGMRVYIQPGCAEPETLVEALIRRAPFVRDVEIVHMMMMGTAEYVAPSMTAGRITLRFISAKLKSCSRAAPCRWMSR